MPCHVSPVKYFHLLNPRRLAWHDRTPVGCSVQPKRLVKVRERGRLARAARPQPWRNRQVRGGRLVSTAAAEGPPLADDAPPRHDPARVGDDALGPGTVRRRHPRDPRVLVRLPADPRRVPDGRGRETGRDRGPLVQARRSTEARGRTPEMRDPCAATGSPPVARVRAVTHTGTNQAVFRQRQSSKK